ncbi:MAG: helix-turn-helix transcriptional regulator [Ruminococcaceae bacterium]|nr:helix-turn-helix transcriptional regulator [Oscillospiraceae bacterium]
MNDEFAQNYTKIGLKVSYYRKLKGMTQEQLANKMNVATSFIGQIEAPNIYKPISLDTLFRIAKCLEVEPYRFLDFE